LINYSPKKQNILNIYFTASYPILDADIPRLNGLIKAQAPEPISVEE